MEMTKEEIIRRSKEGYWELQEDVDHKRAGQHVWIKKGGKNIYVQIKNSSSFQNGCARAEKEIQNKLQNAGMKVENIDASLMKQLESKGFYGLIDKLKRGEITEDQARRSLAGDKNAVSLPGTRRPDEPLIFGKTAAEIARMQKSGPLKYETSKSI